MFLLLLKYLAYRGDFGTAIVSLIGAMIVEISRIEVVLFTVCGVCSVAECAPHL